MSDHRKEKDSLGFVEVPSKAYYGAQTARAVDNFPISGLSAHTELVRALGMVKRAAAEANKELGLVDANIQDRSSTVVFMPGNHSPEKECWYIDMGVVDPGFFNPNAMQQAGH